MPHHRAGVLTKGEQATRQSAGSLQETVGICDVDVRLIGGRSPHDAATRAAFAHASLPEDRAFMIRIERVHDAGFLTRQQQAVAVPKIPKDQRRSEVVRLVLHLTPG